MRVQVRDPAVFVVLTEPESSEKVDSTTLSALKIFKSLRSSACKVQVAPKTILVRRPLR